VVYTSSGVQMLSEKELQILAYLRENGRHTVTQIGHKLGIPRTSVFDKIKKFKQQGIISNFNCIIDFEKIGKPIQVYVLFKANNGSKKELQIALSKSSHTNTVVRLGNDFDILSSFIFENMSECHEYIDYLSQKFDVREAKVLYAAREIKREGYFTNMTPKA